MSKTFRHYLAESARTYHYTIKIAGDIDKNFVELFKYNLNKFDPVKVSGPVATPIQKDPYGFPGVQNQSVHIFKAEFKYPATEPQIQQIAQLLGQNINTVRVVTTEYNDSINGENDLYANQGSPLLGKEDGEQTSKEASQDYANQYLDKVTSDKPSIDIPYAGAKTPIVKNTSKEGIYSVSPMSKVMRPPKPATGASK